MIVSNDKNHFYTNLEIPLNACFVHLQFIDKNLYNYHLPNYYIPIYRIKDNNAILMKGANLYQKIDTSRKEIIRQSIEWERKNYPENGLIYLFKWLFEKESGLLNKNSINNDYLMIRNSKEINKNQKEFLYFFINFMEGNNKEAIKHLERVSRKHLPEIFNNIICFRCFYIFSSQPYLDDNILKPIYQNIVANNPNSYFTTKFIDMGNISRYNNISIVNKVFNDRISSANYNLLDLLYYSMNLIRKIEKNDNPYKSSYNYVDSIKKGRIILDSLFQYYYSPLDEKKLEFNQISLIIKKQMLFSTYLWSYLFLDDYKKVVVKSKELLNKFNLLDPVISDLYYHIAIAFEKLNKIDSATYYMTTCVNLSPSNEFFYNEFENFIKRNYKVKNIDRTIDSLLNTFNTPRYKLPENAPRIRTEKSNISLKSNNRPILIEFFTTSCKPCMENIHFLMQNKFLFEKFDIFLISPEVKKTVQKYFKKNNLNLNYVTNPDELMNFFRVNSFPETIIIDEKGQLLKRFNDTYTSNFIKFIDNFSK